MSANSKKLKMDHETQIISVPDLKGEGRTTAFYVKDTVRDEDGTNVHKGFIQEVGGVFPANKSLVIFTVAVPKGETQQSFIDNLQQSAKENGIPSDKYRLYPVGKNRAALLMSETDCNRYLKLIDLSQNRQKPNGSNPDASEKKSVNEIASALTDFFGNHQVKKSCVVGGQSLFQPFRK